MNHVEDTVKKEQTPAYDPSEIIREAGLDRSPDDIAREYYARLQSPFWRLVYRRQKFLETEKLNGRQRAILLRAIGWSVYAICMTVILTAALMGWISWPVAATFAAAVAAAVAAAAAATVAFAVAFAAAVAAAVAAAAAATVAFAVAFAGAVAAAGVFAGAERSSELKEPFLRSLRIVFGRLFLYFPFMPAVRLFDLWAERKRNDMPFMHAPASSAAPKMPKRRLDSICGFLADKREVVLRREELLLWPNAILLRAIGWSVYAICMTVILTAALMGWISWPVAATFAVAFAGAVAFAAAGAERSSELKEPFLRSLRIVFGRLFLYFPIMPFVRFFDYRVAKRLEQPAEREERQQALLPAEHIRQTYLSGIAKVRECLLGDSSELIRSKKDLEERLARIRTDQERVEHRKGQAERDENQTRIATLSTLLRVLDKREQPIRQTLDRLQGIVSKSSAFLLECEAKVNKLDGPLGDAELATQILADGERDSEAIEAANLAIQRHVAELGNAVMRLHGAIAQAALPAHTTDDDLTTYFEQVEAVAEEVANLQIEAEQAPDTTVH